MKGKGVVVVVVLMFVLALGAGAALALLVQGNGKAVLGNLLSPRVPAPTTPVAVRGTLSDILHLTPDQNSQMQQIWQDVSKTSNECIDDAKTIQIDEDKELIDHILTTSEQKEQFQALRNRSKAKLDALAKKRDTAFKKAVDQTRKILNDDQRHTYDQIIQDRIGTLPDPSTGGASLGGMKWDSARAFP